MTCCLLSLRGGGFSLCGKFDRDNRQSLRFLQPGFARRRPTAASDLSALETLLALNGNSLLSHVRLRELLECKIGRAETDLSLLRTAAAC